MRARLLVPLVCTVVLFSAFLAAARGEEMTFVMDPFPPFTFEKDGVAAGPLADTIRAVCEELKIRCKQEAYPWRRALKLAEDGHVDGIYAIAPIPERAQFFYVSPPIVESAYGVFVAAPNRLAYAQPRDLAGYTVGVYGPSAASRALGEVAAADPSIKVLIEVDNETLLKKLSSGRYGEAGAALANVDVGRHLIAQEKISGLRVAGLIGKTEYTIGLSRKRVSPARAEAFNATLERLIKSGKVRQIVERHGLKATAQVKAG
jgi:polar amino acid transport system substrate-binding protein